MAERKKRSRKKSKYAPLIWILTGALIAFFISFSGNIRNSLQNTASSAPSVNSNASQAGFQLPNFFSPGKTQKNANSSAAGDQASSSLSDTIHIKLYLASQGEKEITLAPKEADIPRSAAPLKSALEALIQCRDDKLLNLVPMNSKILKVWIKDDVAYLDFSEEFSYNSYGISGYNIQIYQVVYTAAQFQNIRAVYFYMNGKPLKYLGGDGYILNNPIYPYSSLPKFPL